LNFAQPEPRILLKSALRCARRPGWSRYNRKRRRKGGVNSGRCNLPRCPRSRGRNGRASPVNTSEEASIAAASQQTVLSATFAMRVRGSSFPTRWTSPMCPTLHSGQKADRVSACAVAPRRSVLTL